VNTKDDAGNSALQQVARHFSQPFAQRAAERHADRPGEFHVFDVLADDLSIVAIIREQAPARSAERKRQRAVASRFLLPNICIKIGTQRQEQEE